MDLTKLETIFINQPAYRLKQARQAVFHNLITNWSQATSLPPDLREILNKECSLEISARILQSAEANAVKALITLTDGAQIETVLMQHSAKRNTVCVSSQVGCPLACSFCATGQMGLIRNLTSEEILEQILFFARYLKKQQEKVNNIVFMGMGEPLLNFQNVAAAIKFINSPEGFNIGSRHISVSTAGVVPGLKLLKSLPGQINLAWSLHAPNNKLRNQLMQINQQYPLEQVIKELKDYLAKSNRRLMLEYLMIDGVNDSLELAEELAVIVKKLDPKLAFVNLITYNPTGNFLPSPPNRIQAFKNHLLRQGIQVLQRYKFGTDIQAACGQLATKFRKRK
jgi:23S rRNA (adenine(2503)-C(2))-methyltransferase